MRHKLFLLFILIFAPLLVGCGDSDEFIGGSTAVSNNNQFISLIPNLSGATGQVRLQTTLAAQTVTIVSDASVPTVVDTFRITGFNEDNILVYGPVIRSKATVIDLEEVPVEVVSLRIELLADVLIVGGLSTPVTITEGETFIINNPEYSFIADGEGNIDPGTPTASSAYGSYTGGEQFTDSEGDPEVNFPTALNEVGITSNQGGEEFQVAAAGDYLITVTLVVDSSDLNQVFTLQKNGTNEPDTSFIVTGGGEAEGPPRSYTAQFILSLVADDTISVAQNGGNEGVDMLDTFLTIVRLGDTPSAQN